MMVRGFGPCRWGCAGRPAGLFLALLMFHGPWVAAASQHPTVVALKRSPVNHKLSLLTRACDVRGGNADPSATQSSFGYEQQQQQQYQQPLPMQSQPPIPQQKEQQPPPPYQEKLQQQPALGISPEYPASDPFRETNQDRIDRWRNYQREHQEEQQQMGPRDEQGRVKLMVPVAKGTRAFVFFLLMWRNVHLYETVDQSFKGVLRFLGVAPLTILFLANMAGVVASITSPGHSAKKRLKAILNLDKLLEFYLMLWSLFRLVIAPSPLVPREMYISHILHSFFFILQCQTVTRLVWNDEVPPAQPVTSGR